MKLLILCIMTVIGFTLGVALGARLAAIDALVLCATLGGVAGMVVGEVLLHAIGSRRKRKPLRIRADGLRPHLPAPFGNRLAQFTHCSPADGGDDLPDRSSSMPFWTAREVFRPTRPRSLRVIRRALRRIDALLRRNA